MQSRKKNVRKFDHMLELKVNIFKNIIWKFLTFLKKRCSTKKRLPTAILVSLVVCGVCVSEREIQKLWYVGVLSLSLSEIRLSLKVWMDRWNNFFIAILRRILRASKLESLFSRIYTNEQNQFLYEEQLELHGDTSKIQAVCGSLGSSKMLQGSFKASSNSLSLLHSWRRGILASRCTILGPPNFSTRTTQFVIRSSSACFRIMLPFDSNQVEREWKHWSGGPAFRQWKRCSPVGVRSLLTHQLPPPNHL